MAECMDFPNTFKEFIDEYSFKDRKEIYTNGSELIQTFRVMQGYEHFIAEHDKQIRNETIDEFVKTLEKSLLEDEVENGILTKSDVGVVMGCIKYLLDVL